MSSVLNYVTANNLSLITWLDASPSNIVISGNNFTWVNKTGNTSFDFIQTLFAKHPSVTSDGVSFTSNTSLSSRNTGLINGKSYSIIAISKDNAGIDQVLISLRQLVNSSVDVIKYSQLSDKLLQEYQRTYLKTLLNFSNSVIESVNIICINHFVKLGRTSVRVNDFPYELVGNIQNAYKMQVSSSIIGEADLLNLYHFLVFSPAIEEAQLDDIVDLLIASTSALNPNPFWDLIITDTWNNLTEGIWNNIA
jgi:hypothetical protein